MQARRKPIVRQPQRQYDKSGRTQAAILEAATREFSAHGLAGARVDRIAKAARVNNHALYYHFGKKDALFQAVLENGYEGFRTSRPQRDLSRMTPEAGMARIVSDVFDFVESTPAHMAMVLDENRYRGAHLSAEVRKRIHQAASPLLHSIESVLQRGKAEGCFARNIDPEHLYFTIFGACNFYFTNAYTVSAIVGRDLLKPRAVRERKKHIVGFVLAALRK